VYKSKSRKKRGNLIKNEVFWNQVVEDITAKITETKKGLADLESAKMTFRRNAERGAPIPGESACLVTQLDSQSVDEQHSD